MRRGRHSGERKRSGGRPLLGIGGSQHHELVWRNRKAHDIIAWQFCGRGPDPPTMRVTAAAIDNRNHMTISIRSNGQAWLKCIILK